MLSHNPNSAFSIDSNSGQIFTAQTLNSVSDTNYTIGVSAFENGNFLGMQEFDLHVLDAPSDTLIIQLTDVTIEYQNNEALINLAGDILNYDEVTQEYGEIESLRSIDVVFDIDDLGHIDEDLRLRHWFGNEGDEIIASSEFNETFVIPDYIPDGSVDFSKEYMISGFHDNLNTYFLTSRLDELSFNRFENSDTEYPELIINQVEHASKSGIHTLEVSGTAIDNEEIEYVYFDFNSFSSYIDGDLLEDDGSFSFEIAPPEWARDDGQFTILHAFAMDNAGNKSERNHSDSTYIFEDAPNYHGNEWNRFYI